MLDKLGNTPGYRPLDSFEKRDTVEGPLDIFHDALYISRSKDSNAFGDN